MENNQVPEAVVESNPYDDFYEKNAAAPGDTNPYDDFYQKKQASEVRQNEALTSFNVAKMRPENPDQYAEAISLSKKTGMPADFVASNFEKVKRESDLNDTSNDDLIKKRPGFFSNPDNALLAKDDMDSLKKIDQEVEDAGFFKNLFSSVVSGAAGLASGIAKSPALFQDDQAGMPFGAADNSYDRTVQFERGQKEIPRGLYDNDVTRFLDKTAKDFAPPQLKMSIIGEAKSGNYANAAKAFAFQVASNAPQLALIAATRGAGLGLMGLSSSGSKLSENLEKGIDADKAKSNAIFTGAIETGIESISGVGGGGFKAAIKEAVSELGEKTALEVFKKGFVHILKTGGEEGLEEAATTLAQASLDYGMSVDNQAMDGIVTKMGDAFIVGAGSGMQTTALSLGGATVMKQFSQHADLIQNVQAYQNIGNILKESKLFKRNPEAAKSYLQETLKGSGAEKVYIDVEDFDSFFQGENKSGVEAASELSIAEQYKAASENGGDIEINTADWAAVAANTDYYQGLAKDIKFDPQSQTIRQAELARTEAKKQIKAADEETNSTQAKDILPTQINSEEDAIALFKNQRRAEQWIQENEERAQRGEAMGEGEAAYTLQKVDLVRSALSKLPRVETRTDYDQRRNSQTREVYDYVFNQLTEQGMSRDEAQKNATVWGERYFARAERAGFAKSPIEFAQERFKGFNSTTVSESGLGVVDERGGNSQRLVAMQSENGEEFYQAKYGEFQVRADMPTSVKAVTLDASVLSEERHQSLKNAKDHASDNLRNQSVRNEMTGMDIDLPQGGFKKVYTGQPTVQNIVALTHIDQLIKNAVYDGPEAVEKNKPNIKAYHRFYAPMNIGNTQYLVRIKVAETSDGTKFYHEVGVEKEIPAGNLKPNDSFESDEQAVSGENGQVANDPSTININQFAQEINTARQTHEWFQGQEEGAPRGRIRFGKDRMAIIDLFQHKDRSTVMHESAHLWLEESIEDAFSNYSNDLHKSDLDALLNWFGLDVRVANGEQAVRQAIEVKHHEQFAEGFEAYLQEGKAPNKNLAKAFAAFRVWLTDIYGLIKNLRAPLNPEVRQVMDRLVSIEASTKQAEADQGYNPLLNLEHLTMMNDTDRVDYLLTVEEAKEEVRNNITAAYMADLQKRELVSYKETKARITTEEKLRLNDDPALRTESIIRKGTLPDGTPIPVDMQNIKIDKASLVQLMGTEIDARIEKLSRRKDGLPVQVVAEMFGWADAKQMIQTIMNSPTTTESLEAAVDDRMGVLFPDNFNPDTAAEEAADHYHNEAQEKLHRLEIKFLKENAPSLSKKLIELLGKTQSRKAYYKTAAEDIIKKTKESELRAFRYQQTERKKNLEAHRAMARGDFEAALKAKHDSLLNFELYKQAKKVEERIEKDQELFGKAFRSDKEIAKNRDMHIVEAMRAMINFLDGADATDVKAPLEKLQELDPEAFQNMTDLVNNLLPNLQSRENLTTTQYIEVSDAVRAMWDYAREIKQVTLGDKKVDLFNAINEMVTELTPRTAGQAELGMEQALGTKEKAILGFQSLKASITRLEHWTVQLGGGKLGAFFKYLYQPLVDADTTYKNKKTEELVKLNEIVKNLGPQSKEEIVATGLGYTFKDITEVLGALIHTGNKSNLERLLLGRKWAVKNSDGSLDTSRWDGFVAKLVAEGKLTKHHYDFLQDVWNFMESHKAEAWRTHYKIHGYYPKEITIDPIQTAFGTYRGGYAPAVYDSDIRAKVDKATSSEIVGDANALAPTTGSGFTKERADNYYDVIKIDLNSVIQATDKALKFTYLQPAIVNATRILNNDVLSANLNKYDRTVVDNMIRPAIQRLARQSAAEMSKTRAGAIASKAINALRAKTSLMFLAWNVPNWFQNFTGVLPALVDVQSKSMLSGFKEYLKSPQAFNQSIIEKSPYMKARQSDHSSKLLETFDKVLNDKTKFDDFRDRSVEIAFIGEGITNSLLANVTWSAAYREAIDSGLAEVDAVTKADSVVRTTQTDASVLGMSNAEAGPAWWRLFGMFSTYFNGSLNKMMSEFQIASQEQDSTKANMRRAKAYLFVLAAPAMASSVIMRAFAGKGIDEDDDGEYMDDILEMFFMSQVRFFLGGVPVVGSMINFGLDKLTGKSFNDKLSISPAFSVIETAADGFDIVSKLFNGETIGSKDSRAFAYAVGLATGYPTTMVSKPAGYLLDVKSGKATPDGPVDFARGLVTGKKGN